MKVRIAILSLLAIFLYACKKEATVPNAGIYRGNFREYGPDGDTLAEGVVFLALHESNQVFDMRGDTNSLAPAKHMGEWVVDGASTMQFTNTSGYNSQYDIDHYLDTTFFYTFDDLHLTLTQSWDGKTYEYVMQRH